jgi:hypothetical protein
MDFTLKKIKENSLVPPTGTKDGFAGHVAQPSLVPVGVTNRD